MHPSILPFSPRLRVASPARGTSRPLLRHFANPETQRWVHGKAARFANPHKTSPFFWGLKIFLVDCSHIELSCVAGDFLKPTHGFFPKQFEGISKLLMAIQNHPPPPPSFFLWHPRFWQVVPELVDVYPSTRTSSFKKLQEIPDFLSIKRRLQKRWSLHIAQNSSNS